MIKDGKRNRRGTSARTKGTVRRFKPNAIAAAIFSIQAGAAWANQECGPVGPGLEPEVICESDITEYAGGIRYLEGDIPNGLRLTVKPEVVVNRDPGPFNYPIDVATEGSNGISIDLADGATITASGQSVIGVKVKTHRDAYVDSGANITVEDPTGWNDDHSAAAILAEGRDATSAGTIEVRQRAGSKLTARGTEPVGIAVQQPGAGLASVISAGEIDVNGDNAWGILAWARNATSTADVRVEQSETGRITAQGPSATGIFALQEGSGQVDTVVRGGVKAQGDNAVGLLTVLSASLSNARATMVIDPTASVEVEGNDAYAAWTYHTGTGEAGIVSSGQVKATGDGANGLNVYASNPDHAADAYAHVQGGQVQVSGRNARGVHVRSQGPSRLQATVANGATVQASGPHAMGVEVAGRAAGGFARRAQVQAQIDGTVTARDEFGVGVSALTDEGTAMVTIGKDGRVTGGWQADAASTSAQHGVAAAGVAISSDKAATLANAGRIEAGSDRAVVDTGRYKAGGVGNLTLRNSGTLTGFVELAAGGQNTVSNEAGGVLALRHFADTDGDGTRDTKRVSVSDFGASTSRFDNQAGATVRLAAVAKAATVDAAGFYAPTTGAGSTALPADVYDMTRDGIVQAQMVNLGEFNHAGTIDLRGPAIGNTLVITGAPDAAAGPGAGVFVSNGGRLHVKAGARSTAATDPTDRYADMLVVDRTQLGKGGPTQIHVDYDPADLGHLTVGNGIEVVEVRDKAASAKGAFALGNVVAAGAYEYALNHGGVDADAEDGNWYLRSYVKATTGDEDKPEEVPNYRKEVPLAMAAPSVAHRLGLDLLGTYHDRAGEDYVMLAQGSAMQGYAGPREDDKRAWGQVFGSSGKVRDGGNSEASRYDSFRKNGPRYDYDLGGVQLGMDVYRRLRDDGSRQMAGAYLSASHASARVDAVLGGRAGKLSMDGYSLGGYWTHMGPSRWYIDAVAQVTRYDSVRLRSANGHTLRSDGWGFAASLEAGRPFKLDDKWTLEPQAQLVYQHVSLDATRDRYGKIRFGSTDGLYGRLGARLARNWEGDDGREYGVWARANVWHDFGARAKTTFSTPDGRNPVTLRTGLGGTWGQLGVGFNAQLKDNLNAFIAADYEQSLESSKTRGVSGRIGIQYVW